MRIFRLIVGWECDSFSLSKRCEGEVSRQRELRGRAGDLGLSLYESTSERQHNLYEFINKTSIRRHAPRQIVGGVQTAIDG